MVLDSQSVMGADTVGADTRGYDAGKRINGRRRLLAADTLGLLLAVVVIAASVHDTVGVRSALHRMKPLRHRSVRHVWAGSGFPDKSVEFARDGLGTTLAIVRKPAVRRGCEVHPRR
ncbi:hypothetical protein GCM10023205_80470 [Yinghuangia aomiensis]|uniref:Transposase IS4-like domain-containing protein n=1 Tax=Yinghuangia aomiensis TaxID=676205 RepID=A0ABP9IDE0_9ACTN